MGPQQVTVNIIEETVVIFTVYLKQTVKLTSFCFIMLTKTCKGPIEGFFTQSDSSTSTKNLVFFLLHLNFTEAPGHAFFWPTVAGADPSGCKGLSAACVPSLHTFDGNRCGQHQVVLLCNNCHFWELTYGATFFHKEPSKSHISEGLA